MQEDRPRHQVRLAAGSGLECWRRDSNPHGAYAPPDFHTTIAFATLTVRSLDFLLAVHVRLRPQPQSLYTFFLPPPRSPVVLRQSGHRRVLLSEGSLARDCHHPDVLRFPRVRLNSRREFPTPVLKWFKSDASAIPPLQLQDRGVVHFRSSCSIYREKTWAARLSLPPRKRCLAL